jgi:hypothetical protein
MGDYERSLRFGVIVDVIAPPPGELFSETNDNSLWLSS